MFIDGQGKGEPERLAPIMSLDNLMTKHCEDDEDVSVVCRQACGQ